MPVPGTAVENECPRSVGCYLVTTLYPRAHMIHGRVCVYASLWVRARKSQPKHDTCREHPLLVDECTPARAHHGRAVLAEVLERAERGKPRKV